MGHLALSLLGPFQATLDGQPAEGMTSDRLRGLLAYLAVEGGREHAREQVAALLWPERSDREALTALRFALSRLHSALGDRRSPTPFVLTTRTAVQFNQASDYWLDVTEFESLARIHEVASLERAVSLYRGLFLTGLSAGDSPAFEDWLLLKARGLPAGDALDPGRSHLTTDRVGRLPRGSALGTPATRNRALPGAGTPAVDDSPVPKW